MKCRLDLSLLERKGLSIKRTKTRQSLQSVGTSVPLFGQAKLSPDFLFVTSNKAKNIGLCKYRDNLAQKGV